MRERDARAFLGLKASPADVGPVDEAAVAASREEAG
jgi:hypothetical protein